MSWFQQVPQTAWDCLICPHCREPLRLSAGGLECPRRHHFDLARHGYVSLLGAASRTDTADTAAMVSARAALLGAGHYRPIAEAVAEAVIAHAAVAHAAVGHAPGAQNTDAAASVSLPRPVIEIGAGTGYYLAEVLSALDAVDPGNSGHVGIALDSSKHAARLASRAHPAVLSVVADAWHAWPLADRSAAVALSVFAPRQMTEIQRALQPGGLLVVVTPEPGHLAELISPFRMLTVDEGKAEKLAASTGSLRGASRTRIRYQFTPDAAELSDLVLMGPSAWHLDPVTVADSAAQLAGSPVTVDVTVSTFVKPAVRPLTRRTLNH